MENVWRRTKDRELQQFLFETREGSVTEEVNGGQHLKRIIINFGTVNKARKAKERQSVRESGIVVIEAEEKGLKCYKKG